MEDKLIIEGSRIILRKARLNDLNNIYYNVWSDDNVAKFMFWPTSPDLESAKERLNRTIEYQKDKPMYFVAIKETDEVIGLAGIKEEETGIFSEAGLALSRKYQHQGIGIELLDLLLDLVFNHYQANTFVYYCMKHNEISRKLALHFGFTYDCIQEEIRQFDKQSFMIERYILTRQQYIDYKSILF